VGRSSSSRVTALAQRPESTVGRPGYYSGRTPIPPSEPASSWYSTAMLGALVGLVVGLCRSRASLVAENELLRQQLAAAKCRLQRKRVMFTGSQRLTVALLTRWTTAWRATVTLVQPATVLRWHREGFRLLGDGGHDLAAEGRQATRPSFARWPRETRGGVLSGFGVSC